MSDFAQPVTWEPEAPRLRPLRLIVSWIVAGLAVLIAAWIVPGFSLAHTGAAFLVAAIVAILNAILPPIIAALRLPFTLVAGFLLVLVADALLLVAARVGTTRLIDNISLDLPAKPAASTASAKPRFVTCGTSSPPKHVRDRCSSACCGNSQNSPKRSAARSSTYSAMRSSTNRCAIC